MKKFLVGFAAVAVLLVGSFCVANAPSDRALIERVFQVFVEGFSEGDVVKVMSAITDPFVVDGEPLPRSMLAESLEPPDDDSYRSGGFRDLLLTIEGDKAEGSVKIRQDSKRFDDDGNLEEWEWQELYLEVAFQKNGGEWLLSRGDLVGLTDEGRWSSWEEERVMSRVAERVETLENLMRDMAAPDIVAMCSYPIALYKTDRFGTTKLTLEREHFYQYLKEEFEYSLEAYELLEPEISMLEGYNSVVKCIERSARDVPTSEDHILYCKRELWIYFDEHAHIVGLSWPSLPMESVELLKGRFIGW